MEIIIEPDARAAATVVGKIISTALRSKPNLVLGLATGRTMEAVYAELVRLHREEGLDFSSCQTFNLDEYIGLAENDEHSYRQYMNHHLFLHVNIDLGNTHLPNGVATDLVNECDNYEKMIVKAGGIDLQLLGIGQNGHLGFNEPLSAFRSRTRIQELSPMTRAQNASLFPNPDLVPYRAITMGVGTILDCHRCILLATGSGKASVLAKAVEGPITSMITATSLQLHPACTIILDRAASDQLTEAKVYRGAAMYASDRTIKNDLTSSDVVEECRDLPTSR
jgi:glucosamine-6-phosphate deaminase